MTNVKTDENVDKIEKLGEVAEPKEELKKRFVCPLMAMIEKKREEERRQEEERERNISQI